ncbi:MAG: hypothetical protein O7C56_00200, partial [Rickettsia endosymbiont of Ixodes persulcatus]|nr:hypothetical protein [Rickettsia endosymbiont of Ixodes persulcatus]
DDTRAKLFLHHFQEITTKTLVVNTRITKANEYLTKLHKGNVPCIVRSGASKGYATLQLTKIFESQTQTVTLAYNEICSCNVSFDVSGDHALHSVFVGQGSSGEMRLVLTDGTDKQISLAFDDFSERDGAYVFLNLSILREKKLNQILNRIAEVERDEDEESSFIGYQPKKKELIYHDN